MCKFKKFVSRRAMERWLERQYYLLWIIKEEVCEDGTITLYYA